MKKVGINGFGRIGRLVFRAIVEQGLLGKDLAVVALNDLVPADNLAYPVKYDSTQGRFQAEVSSAKSRPDLPDDSTGLFTDAKMAKGHLVAGAKKVIISAPAKHLGVSRNDKK